MSQSPSFQGEFKVALEQSIALAVKNFYEPKDDSCYFSNFEAVGLWLKGGAVVQKANKLAEIAESIDYFIQFKTNFNENLQNKYLEIQKLIKEIDKSKIDDKIKVILDKFKNKEEDESKIVLHEDSDNEEMHSAEEDDNIPSGDEHYFEPQGSFYFDEEKKDELLKT